MTYRVVIVLLVSFFCSFASAQTADVDIFRPDPEKEKKYLKYVAVGRGGLEQIEEWKNNNTVLYYKVLWYYCESFYIKRNHFEEGVTLDESIIDVSRWESERDENDERIVVLPGYRDVMVLLPANKLKYKPVK